MITNILYCIVAVIALLLIVALIAKKAYTIEREIIIDKPKQEVFDFVKLIKNQDYYNKWTMMDPNSKREHKGVDGTVGYVSTWDSTVKNVGQGEQEIKAIKEGERIDLTLRFIKPFAGVAEAVMTTESITENQTKVKWSFSSEIKYPMNLMLALFQMEKMLGNDLQLGLTNLKTVLEK